MTFPAHGMLAVISLSVRRLACGPPAEVIIGSPHVQACEIAVMIPPRPRNVSAIINHLSPALHKRIAARVVHFIPEKITLRETHNPPQRGALFIVRTP
jgi:hypothetical protein